MPSVTAVTDEEGCGPLRRVVRHAFVITQIGVLLPFPLTTHPRHVPHATSVPGQSVDHC
jgi:hypothetical protein